MTSQAFFSKHRNTTLPVGALLDGNLVQTVTGKSVTLTPALSDPNWLQKKFQQNIQRAADTVIVQYGGKEYALVADYNFAFNDPHWGNADLLGKQIGGKIGIIQDPFGKNGEPVFLGATTPIVGGAVEHLSLGADGKLYADVLVDEQTGPGTWRVYKPLFVWDAPALIQAALDAKARGQTLTTPIDRIKGITGAAGQVAAAIPQRYNGAQAGEYFGWMYGIGTYTDTTVNVAAQGNYGDVIGVDLIKLIAQQQLGLAPLTVKADGTTNWTIAQQQEYSALLDLLGKNLSDFNIGQDQIDPLKLDPKLPADHNKQPRMQLVLKQDGTLYSRNDAEGNLPADFKTSGVFFLAPTINGDDETALRAGKTIAAKAPVTLSFSYKEKGGEKHGIVSVTAHDYASSSNVFFGDRPLDNPGYSAFTLKGTVGVGQANDLLDVYRVEQRLRYFGYSAFGDGVSPAPITDAQKQTPHEFTVNGEFTDQEASALKLFESAVNYGAGHRSFGGAAGDIKRDGIAQENNTDGTTAWLNAYNAPHWMNVYESLRQAQGYITVTDGQTSNKENYGTSWARDLWRGYTYATPSMQNNTIRFNGMTSATLYGTSSTSPYNGPHSTHDVGMAIDLGFNEAGFLSDGRTHNAGEPVDQRIAQAVLNNFGHWSKGDAAILLGNNTDLASGTLPRSEGNNQRAALMSFLSLYDITQRDTNDANGVTIDTGSWDALQIQSGGNLSLDIRTALFGNGSQSSGMISEVIVGGTTSTQNPLHSIRAALDKLGVRNHNLSPHHNHFHIYLRPPERMPIGGYAQPKLLQAMQAVSSSVSLSPLSKNLPTSGDTEMFMSLFVPALPPMQEAVAAPPAIVQMAANTTKPDMIFDGGCNVAQTPDTPSTDDRNGFFPAGQVGWYFSQTGQLELDISNAKVTILQQPKHGALRQFSSEEVKNSGAGSESGPVYTYRPNSGYLGADDATLLVELNGKSYKIHTKFYVVKEVNDNQFYGQDTPATLCANSELKRVAALTFNQDINLAQWGDIIQELATSVGGTEFNQYIATASGITLNFADLPAGALGQTTGSSITLDTNAAGNSWYIDPTPSDNSEYLPTSNPNEWVAKAGSAAAGKMDMLTVLLHEYGHALGIDHNPDAHDYMGTTLTAGVRRLPTADELALMGQLVAQAKSGLASSNTQDNVPNPFPSLPLGGMSLAFAGLLQRNRYGSLNAVLNNSTLTQYAVAANATLTNGSLNNGNGWATQGSVNIAPSTGSGQAGVATLNEISTTQTRLNQVFMVNTHDRYLSFTLSGTALDDLNGAPDDAFEVALLDANSGSSLLGNTGLTRSDAFLNLQGDGTEHLAQGVTRINNADGSRTYRVDLSGVASGTAVNLSFDLIGFGQSGSHVNISDVRLSGLPQLHNDAVTLLEDGTSAKSLVIAGLSQCNRYGGLNVML